MQVLRDKLTCLVTAVFCLALASVSSFAADRTPESSSGSEVIGKGSPASRAVKVFDATLGRERQVSAAEAAEIIRAYWTPERQAAAIPVSMIGDPDAAVRSVPKADGVARRVAKPKRSTSGGVQVEAAISNAEGKVFFHNPVTGQDLSCSGGTVNSPKRRLVWTAGHCVHGGPGQDWMLNWVFYPGYDSGAGFAGAFPYYQLWAKTRWIRDRDRHYDYGVAITWNNDAGWRVVDAVGGNGLIINPGRPFVTAIGYPSNISSETQSSCVGRLSRRSIFNSDQKLNCAHGPGASGEPWLRGYSSGLGDIVSNNSYRLNDRVPPVYGPYYDDATASLYAAAENASP